MPVEKRLRQLNTQAHQKAEEDRSSKSNGPVPGQRDQEAKWNGHHNIPYDLSEKIASSCQNINERHKIHGLIGMVQNKRERGYDRHQGKADHKGKIQIY